MLSILRTSNDLYFNLYLIDKETEAPRLVDNLSEHGIEAGKMVQVVND